MHDQNLGVDAVAEGEPVIHLREQRHHLLWVFGLYLALEAVHPVHVLTLVISARHEEMVGEEQLEPEQGEDALHGEAAPVHEVTVEEVGVLLRGEAIQLEDVHEVEELAVNVAADRELGLVGHWDVHQGGLGLEVFLDVEEDLECVAPVKRLLALVTVHQGLHEVQRNLKK